jgi:hypothetical protein
MPLERKKGPSTCGRGVGPEREPPGRPQHYLSADTLPLAISWVKGDRPIILGEICGGMAEFVWAPLISGDGRGVSP